MSKSKKMRVCYVYPYAFGYRKDFSNLLREKLRDSNIDYDVIYSSDPKFIAPRGDVDAPSWALDTKCILVKIGSAELRYQCAFLKAIKYDLVIIQQENGLLVNYPLQILSKLFGYKVAFFGHGKNYQASNPDGLKERFKKFWINRVDWWFAYTNKSAAEVEKSGFPPDRITAFNNAIDTAALIESSQRVDFNKLEVTRAKLLAGSRNVGVYVGGIYSHKRISFLLEAIVEIRRQVSDFQMVFIGGGADAGLVVEAARQHDWIHYLGPKFGQEKSDLVSLAKVFLMPGLVGLAVLDAFAYGTPMVTTDLPYHSPEIDYLENGVNGLIVKDSDDAKAYASAVASVLQDDALRADLKAGAATALETYTIENMAQRFAEGVQKALM